ncbi:MAG: pilus assembly protein N-terminal domain-containing protein, partial [Terriglobales bacterium]
MSKRKTNLMRALVEGILAGLAVMMLGSLHAVAEAPHAKLAAAATSHLNLLPFEQGLQDRLILLNPPAPGVGTSLVAPLVVLPLRAPLAPAVAAAVPATPAPWSVALNPARLWQAMSAAPAALAAPGAYTRVATGPQPASSVDDYAVRAPRGFSPIVGPAISEPESLGTPVDLRLETHHSLLLQSPVPLKRVSITDDTVAQAIVVSPTQVLIQGKSPGEVSLLLWDADANARAYTVQVGLDPAPLQRELDHLYPGNHLQVSTSGDAVVLSGVLPNAATAK